MPVRAVALPQRAHELVERRAAVAPKHEVERARDERSLRVVADHGVRRVLVLPVELDPRIEARFRDALRMPARRAHHRRERAAEELEIALGVDEAAAHQRQVVVVRGDALERPQLARVRLAREVVRNERSRLDALDVPRMEVLVAREAEKREVVVVDLCVRRVRQLVAAAQKAGARAMLESAVAVAHRRHLEQVSVERRFAEERRSASRTRARGRARGVAGPRRGVR